MANNVYIGSIVEGSKRRFFLIVMTSVLLLILSVLSWFFFNRSLQISKRIEFDRLADQTIASMERKVVETVSLLYDLRGLVTIENRTSKDWDEFLLASGLEARYPGMYSLGYAEVVTSDRLNKYEADVRKAELGKREYDNYYVFPRSENKVYYPVRFVHTRDKDISLLLGFDLGFASEITEALSRAIETEQPQLSELMDLSTIIPSSTQVGYLILVPVYDKNVAGVSSASERQRHLLGFVGDWFNPKMMASLLPEEMLVDMYDGEKKVFGASGQKKSMSGLLQTSKTLKLLNKEFKVSFSSTSAMGYPSNEDLMSAGALAVIILVNLLWYATVYLIVSSRSRAVKLAETATSDLTKFKLAVDGVSDHVIITDPTGIIVYANRAAERMTGYSKEEMVGRTPSVWGKQMGRDFYERFWRTIKMEKKPFVGQITNKKKSGELYDVELSVSPIMDDKGEIVYFVGIEKDITKQKAVEKMKTEFISLASHQLRTPLSAVKWFGKMLADGDAGNLNELQKQYVSKINESNEREIQLVNSLLNVSRIESGRIVVEPKETDIRQLVDAVMSEIRVGIEGTKKQITWSVSDEVPKMMVDPDLLRHVFTNLLTNAVRYTKDDGKIDLKVSMLAGEMVSQVTDNGIGVPESEKERIFEKFFRASNAVKKETDGNGLGLFLAKTIVESSGGKIGFDDNPEGGSMFWFTIPKEGMSKKSGDIAMI